MRRPFAHAHHGGQTAMRYAVSLVFRGSLILLLSCTAAWAQAVSTAQINGTVKDQPAFRCLA